jgi:hypothetical protein
VSAQNHIDLLGKTAKDRVTGFQGVVSSVSFDLYGCLQAAISPPLDKDGKYVDGRWFDVNRLEIVDENRAMPVPAFGKVEFGATPATHTHGPAEKPVPR